MGEGTIFSGRPDVRARPEAAALLARFQARGLGNRAFGLGAYAAVQVWAQAVERAGTFELAAGGQGAAARPLRHRARAGGLRRKGDLEDAAWQWKVWTNGDYVPLEHLAAIQSLASSAR